MSDYIPNPMNDPNDPRRYDKYGNTRFEPIDEAGRGPYILLGILVAIGLIGGLLYFNSPPKGTDVATAPAVQRSMPATPMPAPAIPRPAPAAPATTPPAPADQPVKQ